MAYTIMINEYQRQLLVDALAVLSPDSAEAADEAETLHALLDELPADEQASPGVVHGLCL